MGFAVDAGAAVVVGRVVCATTAAVVVAAAAFPLQHINSLDMFAAASINTDAAPATAALHCVAPGSGVVTVRVKLNALPEPSGKKPNTSKTWPSATLIEMSCELASSAVMPLITSSGL